MNLVQIAAHHTRAHFTGNIVGDDPVDALALALGLGVFDHVLCFGGKADKQVRTFASGCNGSQNIGIFREDERGRR